MLGGSPAGERDPVRVLVVDDHPGFRGSLTEMLGGEDFVVVGEAASGLEALDVASATDPDVMLIDVRMPVMDGIETTKRLKRLFPRISVVAISGFEDHRAVREMLMAGAAGYVLKDSEGDDIVEAVRRAAVGRTVSSVAITPTIVDELIDAFTKERQRTRELEGSHAALLERDARRSDLVSALGRELSEPVTDLVAAAEALGDASRIHGDRSALRHRLIARAGELARLVQRLEAAVEAGLTEWADVSALAADAAEGNERVEVVTPRSPAMASLNRIAGSRILEELIENAVTFSTDEVVLEVRITGSTPEVRVIDRGPGIHPEIQADLFDPTGRTESGRTGLGLAIARMSARAMDGDLLLESTGSTGSTFLWRVTAAL